MTDMNHYVGGIISPYGSPENEDSETAADKVHDALMDDFDEPSVKFPSVEQMRREVETGEFSPESIAVANSILENAEGDVECAVDSYIDQRIAGPLDEVPGRSEDFKAGMRAKREQSRQWREEASKPSPKPAPPRKFVPKPSEVAYDSDVRKMTRKTEEAHKNFVPEPHLTQRPFRGLAHRLSKANKEN